MCRSRLFSCLLLVARDYASKTTHNLYPLIMAGSGCYILQDTESSHSVPGCTRFSPSSSSSSSSFLGHSRPQRMHFAMINQQPQQPFQVPWQAMPSVHGLGVCLVQSRHTGVGASPPGRLITSPPDSYHLHYQLFLCLDTPAVMSSKCSHVLFPDLWVRDLAWLLSCMAGIRSTENILSLTNSQNTSHLLHSIWYPIN